MTRSDPVAWARAWLGLLAPPLMLTTSAACIAPGTEPLVLSPENVPMDVAPNDPEAGPLADAHPVCHRMAVLDAVEVDPEPEDWDGDLASCSPGTPPALVLPNAASQLDYARELADVPVSASHASGAAQECALLMHANGMLSHDPTPDWSCWSPELSDIASFSLLATVPGVTAIRGYLVDPGNDTTLGHRRWLLSHWVDDFGFGSTDAYSCVHLASYDLANTATWTAWPPPGEVPRAMLESYGYTVDSIGWSVQSDVYALEDARVTVTVDGTEHDMAVIPLAPWMGSASAIRWRLPAELHGLEGPYQVRVQSPQSPGPGGSTPYAFEYAVTIIDCP
jgi:hypothetical protein